MAIQWNLLLLVQEFCRRQALPVPANVVTSTDEGVVQLWGLLNEGIQDLQTRDDWRGLHVNFTFTHANGPNYLALDTSPEGDQLSGRTIRFVVNESLWCTSQKIPVAGPIPDADWNSMINMTVVPAVFSYRMVGLGLAIYPVSLVASDFSVEVYQREVILNASGGTWFEAFTADTDIPMLPADLLLSDLRWRYKMEKGLPYAEHQRMFEDQLQIYMSRDGQAGTIRLDNNVEWPQVVRPGLLIPAGNWNV